MMLNRLVPLVALTIMAVDTAAQTPTLKPATAGDKAVQLTWSAVAGATYNIYWGTTSGVTPANATGSASNPGVAYTVAKLENGTAYYFVVTAVIAGKESAPSNEVSATPAARPKAADTPPSSTASGPSTNVGQSVDTNVQTPTMDYAPFQPSSFAVISTSAGLPNGRIAYDPAGVEKLISTACGSDALNSAQNYAIINVINLKGEADAQNVASNNWYVYGTGKTFWKGFARGWQLSDFDGATRLYGVQKIVLLSILENNLTPAGKDNPALSYTVTVTKQQPTNVSNLFQLLGLVFPQGKAPAVAPPPPTSYWACSSVPVAYKTSSIKIELSYTAGGGSPFTASQSFTSEAKQYWDLSFALPVKKASALEYSSTANTVTASQVNKQALFAVIDLYPYPVDLANSKFTFIPNIFGGVAMNSQPLHSLLFGGSIGFKLAQVYAGALLIKQQQLNNLATGSPATPEQVGAATTYSYKPSFSVGIKLSVRSAVTAISGSK